MTYQVGNELDISVVVPAHNSGELIERTVELLAVRLAGTSAELIVVENGSTDDTWARCGRLAEAWQTPGVSFLPLQSAKGMGNALRTGIQASRGRSVLLTADDLPFGFDDLDHLDRLAAESEADLPPMLIGSKAHPDSAADRGAWRGLLTWGFSILRRLVLGMRTRDPQGTLIVDGRLVRELAQRAPEAGFLFTTELVYLVERIGVHPLEVPVRLSRSHQIHRSRISGRDALSMTIGLVRLRVRHHGRRLPDRVSVGRPPAR